MVNDHLAACFPVSSLLKPHVHLLQSAHTHSSTQPLAKLKLSGSDFSLRISHQIWTAGCRFLQGKFGEMEMQIAEETGSKQSSKA